jgi:hypothetical protein
MLREKKTGAAAVARRTRFLLEADRAVEQAILKLEAEGRALQQVHGLRSEIVRAKASEIDEQFALRSRIGSLLERTRLNVSRMTVARTGN